jgi:hypothetical protein
MIADLSRDISQRTLYDIPAMFGFTRVTAMALAAIGPAVSTLVESLLSLLQANNDRVVRPIARFRDRRIWFLIGDVNERSLLPACTLQASGLKYPAAIAAGLVRQTAGSKEAGRHVR